MRGLRRRLGLEKFRALLVAGIVMLAVAGGLAYYNRQSATAEGAGQTARRLDVREWGVNISLPSNIDDAYYVISTSSHDPVTGEPNTMWLGLTSLNGAGCDAALFKVQATSKPIGALIRVAPTEVDPVSGALYTKKYPDGTMIGEYYYAYVPWKNKTCADKATLDGIDSAFTNAVKGMVIAAPARN